MGVPGLTSFLDANTHLLTDLALRDSTIIIDGNNLYHFLYNLYRVPTEYGGDYDLYANSVRNFFSIFLQCNIKPIVVFDGPYDPNDTKVNTALKRARDRIQHAQNAVAGRKANLTPILAQSVFINVLNDLDFDHVTCDAEADAEIAALANTLKCPVLTNDSDFFIFDIESGIVLLDYVNLQIRKDKSSDRPPTVSKHYINVQIYYFKNFTGLFPEMHKDLLALFATVMGNDKADMKTFEAFFTAVHLTNKKSDKLFCAKKQNKMIGLLSWLESCGTLTSAMSKILCHYPREKRSTLQKLIIDSVESYTNIGVSKTLPYLEQKWTDIPKKDSNSESADYRLPEKGEMSSIGDSQFPAWFITEFRQGKLTGVVTNTAISRKVILLPQPENFTQPSSYAGSRPLRSLAYGIILQGQSAEEASKRPTTNVSEVDRELANQKWNSVKPIFDLAESPVPSLVSVEQLPQEKRLEILCEAIGVKSSVLLTWPPDLQMYLSTVIYWINHSVPKINCLHLASVVLCVIKLSAIDELVSKTKDTKTSGDNPITSNDSTESKPKDELVTTHLQSGLLNAVKISCSTEVIARISDKLDKVCKPSKSRNPAAQLDYSIAHAFAQLQSCLLSAVSLNQTLASVSPPEIQKLFSGTFLYNMHKELKSRLKPEAFIPELLDRSPELIAIFETLTESVKACLDPDCLVTDISPGNKRSKKSAARSTARKSKTKKQT